MNPQQEWTAQPTNWGPPPPSGPPPQQPSQGWSAAPPQQQIAPQGPPQTNGSWGGAPPAAQQPAAQNWTQQNQGGSSTWGQPPQQPWSQQPPQQQMQPPQGMAPSASPGAWSQSQPFGQQGGAQQQQQQQQYQGQYAHTQGTWGNNNNYNSGPPQQHNYGPPDQSGQVSGQNPWQASYTGGQQQSGQNMGGYQNQMGQPPPQQFGGNQGWQGQQGTGPQGWQGGPQGGPGYQQQYAATTSFIQQPPPPPPAPPAPPVFRIDNNHMFSNVSDYPFKISKVMWPSVHHYVTAMQFQNKAIQELVRRSKSPQEATAMASVYERHRNPRWTMKDQEEAMSTALQAKFTQWPVLHHGLWNVSAKIQVDEPHDASESEKNPNRKLGEMLKGLQMRMHANAAPLANPPLNDSQRHVTEAILTAAVVSDWATEGGTIDFPSVPGLYIPSSLEWPHKRFTGGRAA